MDVRVVKGSTCFNDVALDKVLVDTKGPVAVLAAKSILSTEIMKILQPLVGTNWSPNSICKDIMGNIKIEAFAGVKDSKVLESLLYNEFYKVALEISSYTRKDATHEVSKVIDKLRPILSTVLLLLSRSV